MGNRAPVHRTIQNLSIYFQGVYTNNSARLPNHGAAVVSEEGCVSPGASEPWRQTQLKSSSWQIIIDNARPVSLPPRLTL